jgi:hypothetical protein
MLHLETNAGFEISLVIFEGTVNGEKAPSIWCDDHAQGIENSKLFTVRKYRENISEL